jgi:hypothetical protein
MLEVVSFFLASADISVWVEIPQGSMIAEEEEVWEVRRWFIVIFFGGVLGFVNIVGFFLLMVWTRL